MEDEQKAATDRKLVEAFHRVEKPLVDLVSKMTEVESPAAIDDATFSRSEKGVRLEYRVRPVALHFVGNGKRITVSVAPIAVTKEV